MASNHDLLKEITIRNDIRCGDAGYLTYLQAKVFGEEYGYSHIFEAYVAKSFYDFLMNYNPEKDRIWIAEREGKIVGNIAIVDRGDCAQLRWFITDPAVRGIGLGYHLLHKALEYCRQMQYPLVYLETCDDLKKAISLYTAAGFTLVKETPNDAWRIGLKELEYILNL